MSNNKSFIGNMFHKNGRAMGAWVTCFTNVGFFNWCPRSMDETKLASISFVMMPTLIFLTILLVFLVASER